MLSGLINTAALLSGELGVEDSFGVGTGSGAGIRGSGGGGDTGLVL